MFSSVRFEFDTYSSGLAAVCPSALLIGATGLWRFAWMGLDSGLDAEVLACETATAAVRVYGAAA